MKKVVAAVVLASLGLMSSIGLGNDGADRETAGQAATGHPPEPTKTDAPPPSAPTGTPTSGSDKAPSDATKPVAKDPHKK